MNLRNLCQETRWWQRAGFAFLLLTGGCGKEEIRVYEVPKEVRPGPVPSQIAAAPPQLKWTLPEGWEEQPRSGIRAANFLIPGAAGQSAEVSVVALPGVKAAMTDIVNMWRQQIGLGEVEEREVTEMVEKVKIGPGEGELFDMAGAAGDSGESSDTRILVAMSEDNGVSWFFKMTGGKALVGEKRPSFLKFLETVDFEYPQGGMARVGPPSAGFGPGAEEEGGPGRKPHWTVPGGWTEVAPGRMTLARFQLGDAGSAELTVSVFPGGVGGTFANVNRWRGQLGLPAVDQAGLAEVAKPFAEAGPGAVSVDMTGGKRMLAVIVPREGQSWFYKLVGDPEVLEREKGAFLEFVKTVDYSHDR